MKVICTQENLNQGLITVNKLASQNINLPILNNILLETKERQLRLATTNLEIGINCFIRGKILEPGNVTIPASLITNYVNSLSEGKIILRTEKDSLEIKTESTRALIRGLPATDFPFQYKLITKIKKGIEFGVREVDLREGVSRTCFASAPDELRPEIAGVLFGFDNRRLTLVATDSYRLAERKINLEDKAIRNFKAIIPIKAVKELLHILENTEEMVKIFFSEGQVLIEVRNIDFTARLVEGQYPDYKQIIPQNLVTRVKANVRDLAQTIKRASFFAARETNDVRLKFNPKKGEILVSSETSGAGSNESKVKAKVAGPSQEIVYNHHYFLDGLANISTTEMSFETNGQEEPGVLKPASKDEHFLYLVMPIRS